MEIVSNPQESIQLTGSSNENILLQNQEETIQLVENYTETIDLNSNNSEEILIEEPGYGAPPIGPVTRTSQLINDGEDGTNKFLDSNTVQEIVEEKIVKKLDGYSKVVNNLWIVNAK